MVDALFIGNCTKDIIFATSAPPASDQRILASSWTQTFGGVAGTAAIAFQKLGGKAGIVSVIGDDEVGREIKADLESTNFTYIQLKICPNKNTAVSTILVENNGKRLICHYPGCNDELTFTDVMHALKNTPPLIHLGVVSSCLMLQIAKYCGETSIELSIDGGNLPIDQLPEVLPYTDYFILDDKTSAMHGFSDPFEACLYYQSLGAKFVTITRADLPTVSLHGEKKYVSSPPRHHSIKIVDTTGAGDNYHGAFLYFVSSSRYTMQQCLDFAACYATLSCTEYGGRAGQPSLDTVMRVCTKEN